MTRISLRITIGFFCLLSALQAFAQIQGLPPAVATYPKDRVLRVVCDNNYPPYVFIDKNGLLHGIVVDQWQAWERVTGMRVDLRGMDWNLAQKEIAEGKADVIDTIFKTAAREQSLAFSQPYAKLDVPVFFHESISGIATIDDLVGFKIAVKEGDACIDTLRFHGISTLVTYPSYEAIVAAAAAGIEKIFCIDQPPAQYYLAKAGISSQFRFALNLYTGYFHRAVRQGDATLLNQVEAGFSQISKSEFEKIDQRWHGKVLRTTISPKLLIVISGSIGVILAVAFGALIIAALLKKKVTTKTAELANTVRELQASEAKNEAILEAQPDLLFVMDRSSRFLEFKAKDPGKLFIKPEFFLGKTIDEVFHDEKFTAENSKAISAALDTGGVHIVEYSLPFPDGAHFFESRVVRLDDNKALSISRDVTQAKESEIKLKDSLLEKEALLREIHHRVKNNLQIVSSMLSLQAERFQNQFDRELFTESQGRIRAMAQVHERLYNSKDFSFITAADYVRDLIKEISNTWYSENLYINIEVDANDVAFELDKAVSIGLLLNELITNAYKYAFCDGSENILRIHIEQGDNEDLLLSIKDNGKGMPAGFDPEKSGGMGYTIIRALCQQLHATLSLKQSPEEPGTEITIHIPNHRQA